jgi:hypothetical protein
MYWSRGAVPGYFDNSSSSLRDHCHLALIAVSFSIERDFLLFHGRLFQRKLLFSFFFGSFCRRLFPCLNLLLNGFFNMRRERNEWTLSLLVRRVQSLMNFFLCLWVDCETITIAITIVASCGCSMFGFLFSRIPDNAILLIYSAFGELFSITTRGESLIGFGADKYTRVFA